jgi:LmbE family N-acetylglucosaminyl deacetylase
MYDLLKHMRHLLRRQFITVPLSVASLRSMPDYRSILLVAPHPDDEIIGIGGFLVRHLRAGRRAAIVYLTDGERSLEDLDPSVVASERSNLTNRVLSRLGVPGNLAIRLHLPDGDVPRANGDQDQFLDAARRLRAVIDEERPDAVLVTHPLETWPYDHVAAHELVVEALKSSSRKCDLYGYWVWLWYCMPLKKVRSIRWRQVSRLDIMETLSEKAVLMDQYLGALAPDGRPWSGVLPKAMLKVFERPYEVVEKLGN